MTPGSDSSPSPAEDPSGQLTFGFVTDLTAPLPQTRQRASLPEPLSGPSGGHALPQPHEPGLPTEQQLSDLCREWLLDLELPGAAKLVRVLWNSRLRSTAGYASYPAWRIELNPRLADFDGQTLRTLKHELAHLIAYHQARRRRISPHGPEWRTACAQLGIPDERACHSLPLPRKKVARRLAYRCPSCGFVLHRVRPFRRPTACLTCCNAHAGGRFDKRFAFQKLAPPEAP